MEIFEMGAYSYLVNEDTKQVVFLEKGEWHLLFRTLKEFRQKDGYIKCAFKSDNINKIKTGIEYILFGVSISQGRARTMLITRFYNKLLKFIDNSVNVYCLCDYIEEFHYSLLEKKINENKYDKVKL